MYINLQALYFISFYIFFIIFVYYVRNCCLFYGYEDVLPHFLLNAIYRFKFHGETWLVHLEVIFLLCNSETVLIFSLMYIQLIQYLLQVDISFPAAFSYHKSGDYIYTGLFQNSLPGVSKLLASLGHTGRRRVVLGHTLNIQTLMKTDEQKKKKKVLSKFTVLCWASSLAILGCIRPVGCRLDTLVSVNLLCLFFFANIILSYLLWFCNYF